MQPKSEATEIVLYLFILTSGMSSMYLNILYLTCRGMCPSLRCGIATVALTPWRFHQHQERIQFLKVGEDIMGKPHSLQVHLLVCQTNWTGVGISVALILTSRHLHQALLINELNPHQQLQVDIFK
jgi:hypothetical protein